MAAVLFRMLLLKRPASSSAFSYIAPALIAVTNCAMSSIGQCMLTITMIKFRCFALFFCCVTALHNNNKPHNIFLRLPLYRHFSEGQYSYLYTKNPLYPHIIYIMKYTNEMELFFMVFISFQAVIITGSWNPENLPAKKLTSSIMFLFQLQKDRPPVLPSLWSLFLQLNSASPDSRS